MIKTVTRNIKLLIMVLILVLLSQLIVGCSISEFFEKEGEAVFSRELYRDELLTDAGPGPVFGGEVHLFCIDVDTFHPLFTQNTYIRMMSSLVFDSLFTIDKDQIPNQNLIESFKNTNNNTVWEFTLKKGIKFHNGKSLTADDVIYSIKLLLNNEDSCYSSNVKNIVNTEYIGQNKFRVVLNKSDSLFRSRLTFPIVPDGFGLGLDNNINKNNYVGTGQYKLDDYIENKEITLIRTYPVKAEKTNNNVKYRDSINIDNNEEDNDIKQDKEGKEGEEGKEAESILKNTYIDKVRFSIYTKEDNIIDEFLMKRTDIAFVKQSEYVKYSNRTDIVLKEYADSDANVLIMNHERTALENPEIRSAISYAINRGEILEQALLGAGEITDILLYPESYLLKEIQTRQTSEELSEKIFEEQNCIKSVRDGMLYYRNKPMSFNLLVNYEAKEKVETAEILKAQLKQKGIQIDIIEIAFNELINAVNSGNYDMAIVGMRVPEAPNLRLVYGQEGLSNGSNLAKYVNPELEKLFNEFDTARNEEAQKLVFNDIYDIIMKDMPYTVLYFKNAGVLYNKKIRGERQPIFWNELNQLEKWYILQ